MATRRLMGGPACVAAMLAALATWLWPLGIGGRMPVGGDVTQFSIGLMGVLGQSLRAGRLPFWNDLWGYGFPGIAESQMGVYYPPHLLLYGLLSTELAYTLSLVLHVAWGALGAYWLARLMGVSAVGSALAGFVWSASGFFVVHMPHQWGYTVGSWMPWVWALGWRLVTEPPGASRTRAGWWLAAALAVQVLPGHFQVAFITQVGLGVLLLGSGKLGGRAVGRFTLVGIGALALAALQMAPTARLASLASADRDYEYLSGFAATPVHLVSYLAPALFHRSPLWRPVAWDPFHTSPEEHLAYVGLAPLWLAALAVYRLGRADRATRALLVAAFVTLLLSLGPYIPGFSWLCQIPGFSFFRAPARWSAATGLALAVLAGLGWDQLEFSVQPRRGLLLFAGVSATLIGLVVGAWELAVAGTEGRGIPALSSTFDALQRALPWDGDPPFARVMVDARRPRNDLSVQQDLARRGLLAPNVSQRATSLVGDRWGIYARELRETTAILVALTLIGALAPGRRSMRAALLVAAGLDLVAFGRDRPVEDGPIRSLVDQSAVLSTLSASHPGGRILDASRNLPMVAGLAPVSAYRTLDLPAMAHLTDLARTPPGQPGRSELAGEALRTMGVATRVLDPFETASPNARPMPGWPVTGIVQDRALAGWLYGNAWVRSNPPGAASFSILMPERPPSRAWRLAGASPAGILREARAIDTLRGARPVAVRSPRPERMEIDLDADGPSLVVVSQLADPVWEAEWHPASGPERPLTIRRAFDGWQAVEIPPAEDGTLVLVYPARVERLALAFSAACWLLWGLGMVRGRVLSPVIDIGPSGRGVEP
ncbi:hypothetical protein EP7_000599 [Isosphaeraceae bacterium EP7]